MLICSSTLQCVFAQEMGPPPQMMMQQFDNQQFAPEQTQQFAPEQQMVGAPPLINLEALLPVSTKKN